jgi:hypothetical protein
MAREYRAFAHASRQAYALLFSPVPDEWQADPERYVISGVRCAASGSWRRTHTGCASWSPDSGFVTEPGDCRGNVQEAFDLLERSTGIERP